ncbi:phosphomannomutase [Brevibacterium iodinum ATCC 49514]|uniref:Phosphomannomutase n=1 Tax=Brevibacterium iodinum ATCC 49514 TaxID=1255616 RepID=A0A2H1KEB8_9MICO|nr:phospho-sugar mutase [Brevibacterium iodinum]SMX98080.1 phosphomannomutase [Brevibacterium iodinum ATCC 49514]SUW13280.1 Probable phosphomannomutase [Brevibacterium iodinum]
MTRVADRFTNGFDAEVVRAWIADDPDPQTAISLEHILAEADSGDEAAIADLEDRFSGPLVFGTAGLRGEIAAGPNRMNRAVVIRAAAGLAAFLADTVGKGFEVVIGCDARYKSAEFAADTAAVITAAGGVAIQLPEQLPTPLLAFALSQRGADAGVMVTASHNPPADNGYKVYLGQRPLQAIGSEADAEAGAGAQIVSPADALIAERISAVESVASVSRAESGWEHLDESIVEDYLSRIDDLRVRAESDLSIVLTSLHGVGAGVAEAALTRTGFTNLHPVASQQAPDPDFPTVSFPNPEEAGALDESFALAREVGAELIIANDPDADRFSAAIPDESAAIGYRQLSGDEVGLLLGEDAATRLAEGTHHAEGADAPVFANSIVSSRGLATAAASHGFGAVNTLTGFKWISRVAGLVFGYEEALGYCVDPAAVRDKDGISAAVTFAALASRLKAAGSSIEAELDRIRGRDGYFATAPLSFRLDDVSLIATAMAKLRENPPATLAGSPVAEVHDLSVGYEGLPPTDGILLLSESNSRVIVRPSGTEPKLKCYLEVVAEPSELQAAADADARAAASAGVRLSATSASASLKPALTERLNSISTELKTFFAL